MSFTCASLGWDTVIAGERKGGHEDHRRQAWQVMSSGLYPTPPSLHPPTPTESLSPTAKAIRAMVGVVSRGQGVGTGARGEN